MIPEVTKIIFAHVLSLFVFSSHAQAAASSSLRRVLDRDESSKWSYMRVNDPAAVSRQGDNRFSFLLKTNVIRMNNGARQELTHPEFFKNSDQVQFEMWTQAPFFQAGQPRSVVLMQWHESMKTGENYRRPPLAHRWREGHLLVTAWNDRVYDQQGPNGKGLVLARIKMWPGQWYRFQYQMQFGAINGSVKGRYQVCSAPKPCQSKWIDWIDHQGGLGYSEANHYYFKFGVYTTLSYSTPLVVNHAMGVSDLKKR